MSAAQYRSLAEKPKRSKYGAKKVLVDGIRFDSKRVAMLSRKTLALCPLHKPSAGTASCLSR